MKRKKKIVRRRKKALSPLHNWTRKQLETEIQRLTTKCNERSNECYLLRTQKEALEMKLDTLRASYKLFDETFWKTIRR